MEEGAKAPSLPDGMLASSDSGTRAVGEKLAVLEEPLATVVADDDTELVSYLNSHMPHSEKCAA